MSEARESNAIAAGSAYLTSTERRALLEDIGHIAYTLSQRPSKASNEEEVGAREKETVISASASPRPRDRAIVSPLERLHLLRALWRQQQNAFAAILNGADARLVEQAQSVLLAQARGGPKAADTIAQSPRLAAAWQSLTVAGTARFPARETVLEARSTPSTNTWANRLAVHILSDFIHEAVELGRLAAFCDAQPEMEAALQVAREARTLRSHPTLRDCPVLADSEMSPSQCASQILRCALPYQTLYRAWQQLHHPLDFDWTHSPLLTLPALEPWHLYEIWCLLQVAAALHQSGWQLTRGPLLQATPNGLRLVPARGRASRLEFRWVGERKEEEGTGNREQGTEEKKTEDRRQKTAIRQSSIVNRQSKMDSSLITHHSSLSLYYQPLFSSANQEVRQRKEEDGNGFAFCSRSHAMQPDMALHWDGKLCLLDPKFKVYAQGEDAQEDVNKMHAYTDAIVRRGSRSRRLEAPVQAAWCLFAGQPPGEAKAGFGEADAEGAGVYAYPAASAEHPFGTAGVGALQLRPGHAQTTKQLAAFLTFVLETA